MRNRGVNYLACFLTLILLLASSVFAAVPQTINYQGYLTDADGAVNEAIDIKFSIYDVEADGDALWTETQTVSIYNGMYSVLLGTVDTSGNPLDLPFDTQYWLGITVDTDSEMTPRQRFAAVPYAYRAVIAESVADNAVTSSNISADAVTSGKIESGAVTSGKIATDAVGSTEIIDGSITADDLTPGASDDADADPSNELNTGIALVGTELQVTDAGGTLTADLSSLEDISPWSTRSYMIGNPWAQSVQRVLHTSPLRLMRPENHMWPIMMMLSIKQRS